MNHWEIQVRALSPDHKVTTIRVPSSIKVSFDPKTGSGAVFNAEGTCIAQFDLVEGRETDG